MNNEYLSEDRWHKLQETLALAIVPALLVNDEAALGAAYDAAAHTLAGIGIMPEGMRDEGPVPGLTLAA
ncbi:hypothetical protein ACEUZ9_002033 [Paracoccus litorisediminis]|uniref:hypothetical protein n=1 Tax=Paracoccus litorisediminis TaxID=2006130 RepID=UPI003732E979